MVRALDLVAGLAVDAFLLARFAAPGDGRPEGRAWERGVSQLLWRPGLARRQHAGTLGLFGRRSASGAEHELDGAGSGTETAIWIEAKARDDVNKDHVAVFKLKCEDLYRGRAAEDPSGTAAESWWPLLVSSEAVGENVRRLCCSTGIVLCEPRWFPLPVLLRAAARPVADEYLDEELLSEFVRLTERACRPMQGIWRIDPTRRELRQRIDELTAIEIGDLLHLQAELTDDLLDALELHRPGWLEEKGVVLAERLAACVMVM